MTDWIEWDGGEQPVGDEYVDVRLHNGDEIHGWHATHIKWGRDIPWIYHVTAYRISKEPSA